jgi:hypothetical protein
LVSAARSVDLCASSRGIGTRSEFRVRIWAPTSHDKPAGCRTGSTRMESRDRRTVTWVRGRHVTVKPTPRRRRSFRQVVRCCSVQGLWRSRRAMSPLRFVCITCRELVRKRNPGTRTDRRKARLLGLASEQFGARTEGGSEIDPIGCL